MDRDDAANEQGGGQRISKKKLQGIGASVNRPPASLVKAGQGDQIPRAVG